MFEKPLIILGAPRSGTTILHRTLSLHPELWHLPDESHFILEGPFNPIKTGKLSNRVTDDDLTTELIQKLRTQFYQAAINLNRAVPFPASLMTGNTLPRRAFNRYAMPIVGAISKITKPPTIKFLEKTPKNTLRVPLLEQLFPDAHYIWLKRNPEHNIDSLIEGWLVDEKFGPFTRRRFSQAGYPVVDQLELQDYDKKWWCFALVPDWQQLKGQTIADVAAFQYYQCNHFVAEDLSKIDPHRVFELRHEDFVEKTFETIDEILTWYSVPKSSQIQKFVQQLPYVNQVASHQRKVGELRYPEATRTAIEKLSQLSQLRAKMGYS